MIERAPAEDAVRYFSDIDTMYVALRSAPSVGGEDAGEDLVIHYDGDNRPVGYEIERASRHPEHVAAALTALRRAGGFAEAAE
jgi:uncharacterized protein YuzE